MNNNQISVEEYKEASYSLICLIKAALHQEKIILDRDEHMWDIIYYLSQYNHVEGITYLGAKNVQSIPQRILDKWKKDYDTTVYHQFLFEIESQAILQEMEKNGLSYLPVKGARIVHYYPLPGMRFMADNDIVYGFVKIENEHYCRLGKNKKEKEENIKSAQKILMSIMKGRGYECQLNCGNVDVFKKEPIFNFEMHRHLFISGQKFHDYYEDPWLRAKRSFDNRHEYYFLDEDEYIYMIAHTFKHFDVSGCGIRCLIDLYIFLEKKNDSMDWKYIDHELKLIHLNEFHDRLKKLSLSCFKGMSLDQDDEDLLIYLVKSGTYGNIDHFFERTYDRQNGSSKLVKKMKYLKNRLFLSKEECQDSYPFLYRHMYLMPFFTLYKIINAIVLRPKKFFRELKFLIRKK